MFKHKWSNNATPHVGIIYVLSTSLVCFFLILQGPCLGVCMFCYSICKQWLISKEYIRNSPINLNYPVTQLHMCKALFRPNGLNNLLMKQILTFKSSSNPHVWHVGSLRYPTNTGDQTALHHIQSYSFLVNTLTLSVPY